MHPGAFMAGYGGPRPAPPGTHTELYTMLDVTPDASQGTIAASWRRLKTRLHPNRPDGRGDQDAFQNAQNAYQTLSNPRLREAYDYFGAKGVEAALASSVEAVPPVRATLTLSIEDLFAPSTRSVNFHRLEMDAPGMRPTRRAATHVVIVPKGVPDRHRILVRDAGHTTPDGNGDLIVRVVHAVPAGLPAWDGMTLDGFEAVVPVTVSLRLAVLGGTLTVGAIADDGSPTVQRVVVAPRVLLAAPHSVAVRGGGLPVGNSGERGDLVVRATVNLEPLASVVVSRQLQLNMQEEFPGEDGEGVVEAEEGDVVTASVSRRDADRRVALAKTLFRSECDAPELGDAEDGDGGGAGFRHDGASMQCAHQ